MAQLLAGQPLQLDATRIRLDQPITYDGPCPCTLLDMNRRLLVPVRTPALDLPEHRAMLVP
jgi:hypothetical protein